MNERTTFYRKLAYGAAIAALVFPLSWLGQPEIAEPAAQDASTTDVVVAEGGKLAQVRRAGGLSQGNLGEIDPASETLKLATLGLRNVAVQLLWHRANEYKKTEDWGNLRATLDQLSKLQPNFVTFWKFQAWNITYNVSVEFDDYRDRYFYVIDGIEFLKKGERYNRDNPHIQWELGWFIGQKIGRADEHEQYRRLFKADDQFHGDRPRQQRDNWLVGKEWYLTAERSAETRGIGQKSPVVFYSSVPKSQMNYAEAIEEEGSFDRGLAAWREADGEWEQFGARQLEHSTGITLSLNDEQYLEEQVEETSQKLRDLAPEVVDGFMQGLRDSLSDEAKIALDTPRAQRTEAQRSAAFEAQAKLNPSDRTIAQVIAEARPDLETEAMRITYDLEMLRDRLNKTRSYKRTANYDYWALRCDFEQTANAVDARRLCYRAKIALREDSEPTRAAELYERGLAKWKAVLDEFPTLRDPDGTTGDDLMVFIREYDEVLKILDRQLPDDFPLWDIVESFDYENDFTEELQARRERLGITGEDGSATGAPESAPGEADDDAADVPDDGSQE